MLGGGSGALYGQPIIDPIALPLNNGTVPGPTVRSEAELVAILTKIAAALKVIVDARQGAALTAPGAVTAPTPAPTGTTTPAPTPTTGTQGGGGGGGGGSGGASTAKVASFNVLGASHTAAGGNKPEYKSGVDRVPGMVDQLKKHNVEIAGLQEFQDSQQDAFKKAAPGYALFGDKDNFVTWKTDRYETVDQKLFDIPYFEGNIRKMPAVKLKDKQTGKEVWVISVHNPADTKDHPKNAANRAEAIKRERAFIEDLKKSGVPVIITGDFNDDAEARNGMTAGGLTHVADPKGDARNIDWVFGTSGVQFGATTRDTSPRDSKVSDHPIVVTTATF